MPWKLILGLSMLGLAMGIATVFWIPQNIEPFFWVPIFIFSAYKIGQSSDRPFLAGVVLGFANCVWITAAHIVFIDPYLQKHPSEAALMKSMPMPDSPRLMMAMTGPTVGAISGLVIGLLAVLASKLGGPKRPVLN